MEFQIGDVVEMKKKHPCGGKEWEILRVGMDFRLRCCGCSHMIMLSRVKFEKGFKKKIENESAGKRMKEKKEEFV